MDAEAMVADMAEVVGRHAARAETRTAIPRMTLWGSHGPTEPVPALLRPKLYLLLQGRERMTIGGRQSDFAPGRFSVSSLGLPFTAQVVEASPVAPYLGLEVALDPGVIAGLLLDAPDLGGGTVPAIAVSEATADLLEPLGRLLRLLDVPADIPVLAPAFERELCYRLLQGPLGGCVRSSGEPRASTRSGRRPSGSAPTPTGPFAWPTSRRPWP